MASIASGSLVLLLAVAGCTPNPRNEMPAILAAAAHAIADTTARPPCVEREVRRLAVHDPVNRHAPPPPPGFERFDDVQFRGGGGVKGASIGDLRIAHGVDCLQVYGPVVTDNRALVRGQTAGGGVSVWLRRADRRWRVVAMGAPVVN